MARRVGAAEVEAEEPGGIGKRFISLVRERAVPSTARAEEVLDALAPRAHHIWDCASGALVFAGGEVADAEA